MRKSIKYVKATMISGLVLPSEAGKSQTISASSQPAKIARQKFVAGSVPKAWRAISAKAAGGRLLFFGNGGSATDATDWAIDCIAPPPGLRPVAALSLAAEAATVTAIANDIGREFVFLRQLIAHLRPPDVVVALSTSGGSTNVIAALEEARRRGNATIALLGYDGGEIRRRGLADHAVVVRSDYVPRVQEAQAAIYHTLRYAIDWLRDDA